MTGRTRLLLPLLFAVSLSAADEAILPPGCDTAIILEDLPGHLRTLLKAPAVRRVLGEGVVGGWMAMIGQTPDGLAAALDEPGSGIPQRIALGMPNQTWTDLDHLLRFGLRAGLLAGRDQQPDDPAIPKLRTEAIAELRALRLPRLCIAIDFADPMMGGQVQMMLGGGMQAAGFAMERDGRATTYRATLDAFAEDIQLRFVAMEMGLAEDLESEEATAAAQALSALALEVRIEPRETGLTIICGAWPADAAPTPAPRDPTAFCAMRWDITALQTALADAQAWWTAWEGSALGSAAAAHDTQDMIGDLRRMAQRSAELAAQGEAAVTLDAEGFRMWAVGAQPSPAPTLAACGLDAIDLGEPGYLAYDTGSDPARWIGDQLSGAEERMHRQSLQAMTRGDEERSETLEAVLETYHAHFQELRVLTMDENAAYFAPGLLAVMEFDGRIDRLEVQEQEGRRRALRLTALPVPSLALVGRAKSPELGREFVNRLAIATIAPLYRLADREPAERLTTAIATPGGLAATGFDGGWIEALSAQWRIRCEGGSVVHAAHIDDWVVLSTAPALTDRIRAAIAAGRPAAGIDGKATMQGVLRGAAMAAWARDLAAMVRDPQRIQSEHLPLWQDGERDQLAQILDGIGEVFALVGRATWHGRNADGGRRFDAVVPFAVAAEAPAEPAAIP